MTTVRRLILPLSRKAALFVLLLTPALSFAQGQDSTAGERWLLVMSEMLPGYYDNVNQSYFDRRRKLPESELHSRINTQISRVQAPHFGNHVFLWVNTPTLKGDRESGYRLATLKPSDLRRTDGCDYIFKRRANHLRGEQLSRACRFAWQGHRVFTDNSIELSERDLLFIDQKFDIDTGERITGVSSGEPFWPERAREFHCYADLPGVGGGRDIPFERYEDIRLHDKGGTHWCYTSWSVCPMAA